MGSEEGDKIEFKCLIANDDENQLQILELLFLNQNFDVHLARNGFQAFEMTKQSIINDRRRFDLVFLDLQMPISDGYEACRRITSIYSKDTFNASECKNCQSNVKNDDIHIGVKPILIACSALINNDVID